MLDIFKNVKMTDGSLDNSLKVKDASFSVKPVSLTHEDYNFNIAFDPDTFMGIDA